MSRYLEISKRQFKLYLLPNLILSVIVLAALPIFMGVQYLDSAASAYILERFVALTGIIMLTPLFSPEQDKQISEVVRAKATPHTAVLVLRMILAALLTVIAVLTFILLMKHGQCEFNFSKYFAGTMVNAFLLGGIGIFAYALSDNVVVGYLGSLVWYVYSFISSRKMGCFNMFNLASDGFTEKYVLAVTALVLVIFALIFRQIKYKYV